MTGNYPTAHTWGLRCAFAVFLGYAVIAIIFFKPATAIGYIETCARCFYASGLCLGIFWTVFTVVEFIAKPIARFIEKAKREAAIQREIAEQAERIQAATNARLAEEKRRELAAAEREKSEAARIAALPPPPTREELATQARQRYETKLGMFQAANLDETELSSAQNLAKQQYLRELDGIVR